MGEGVLQLFFFFFLIEIIAFSFVWWGMPKYA